MTKMPLTYEDAVSRIGELEAQLADIKNQFKIQIETAHEEGYKEGLAEGGKICKVITERAVQRARQEERQRVMAAFKDAYPAIDTWPCWKALKE